MPKTVVLIHSPLVGPLTWAPVAEELGRRGAPAVVPSLRPALAGGADFCRGIAQCVAAAVARAGPAETLVLVGHSAAGAFLPAIRAALPQRVAAYVFVDARLPQKDASLLDASQPDFAQSLRAMAHDGQLPPWSEWFGPDAMREVVPDDALRQQFLGELGPVPLRLFEEPIPVFAGWPDAPCGYLSLSGAYEPEVEQARAAGWPTARLEGEHLHMLVDPPAVAGAILDLVAQMSLPESGSNIEVRLAAAGEAAAIAAVLHRAFVEYEPLYTPGGFAATTPAAEQIERRWNEGPVWVALHAGRCVGTVAVVPKGEALYVRSMAVLPDARGQNIGAALLQEVEQFARAHDFRRMVLSTTPFLLRAIRLYERFGFRQIDAGPHELAGTPLFTMEKALMPGAKR
jgi:GNAT superfamily N-acetyltransferase